MTINSTTRKAGPFVGNGTVSAFPFGFKVFQASDLFVVRLNVSAAVEQTLVLNSDYSVTLNPDQNSNPGGVVTLSSALASGYTLTLTSDVPDTQPTDLTNQGGFYPEVINDALDRATIQIQQLQEETDRTITAPISTPAGTDLTFPLPSANKFIGWNSTATGLQNLDGSTLASIVAFATAYADTFNGDGVTSTFALSYPPATVRNLDVSINGVTQVPVVDYNINGQALNFTTPPPLGSVVLAKYWQALPNSSGAAQDFTLTPNGYTTAVDVQEGFDDLGSSAGTSKVGFLQAGTGAQARTAQDKLRDVVSVKDFGAVGDGVTDDTAAIQAALTAAEQVYFPTPSVAYLVSSIDIPANRSLITDGTSVKFQQKSGLPSSTRVFVVMGPNVTIGDMTIQGNIATDTDEQSHAIFIYTGTAGTDLYNIRVGNIRGIDIRGDVVFIGQVVASGTVSNVSVASADGNNILRNVVSVVGGSDILVGQVTGSAVGLMHVDIEPDGTYTGNAVNVRVEQVTGRHIGAVVNSPSGDLVFNENIQFGEVNLDPAFATQSTPSYAPGASIAKWGVILRSTKTISIGTLKVNGFDGSAIWKETGGVSNISVNIGQAFLSNCNIVDGNSYGYVACDNVVFGYLNASTPLVTAVDQYVIFGNNCVVQSGVFSLGSQGAVARSVSNTTIQNSVISGKAGATGTYACIGTTNIKFTCCAISAIEYLAGFATGVAVDNSTVTATVAVLNTVTQVTYKQSTLQSQYYAFATGTRTYTEALVFGSSFLWVDASGKLRIKGSAPTSDTDGTVVGTQT